MSKAIYTKNIEVGVFSPSSFNKGKSLEKTEFELAIQESLEYDQRNKLFNREDEGNYVHNSSSNCATVVQRTADVLRPIGTLMWTVITIATDHYTISCTPFCCSMNSKTIIL